MFDDGNLIEVVKKKKKERDGNFGKKGYKIPSW